MKILPYLLIALLPALLGACDTLSIPERVNSAVNAAVTYRAEASGHDYWFPAVSWGDCEDFALAKRVKLIALGYRPADLQILVMIHRVGGTDAWFGHAVLEMVDEHLILDMPSGVSGDHGIPRDKAEYLRETQMVVVCRARDLRQIDLLAGLRC